MENTPNVLRDLTSSATILCMVRNRFRCNKVVSRSAKSHVDVLSLIPLLLIAQSAMVNHRLNMVGNQLNFRALVTQAGERSPAWPSACCSRSFVVFMRFR